MAKFERSKEGKGDTGSSKAEPTYEEYVKGGGSRRTAARGRSGGRDSARKYSSRGDSPRRDSDRRGSDRRDSGRRDSGRGRFGRSDVQMTKVTCSACGDQCEVPFKPKTSKPVFCSDCFVKEEKGSNHSNDFEIVNEKLDKIMKSLKIE